MDVADDVVIAAIVLVNVADNDVTEDVCLVEIDLFLARMVGGVLVERTVTEVVPALVNNRDKVGLAFSAAPVLIQ